MFSVVNYPGPGLTVEAIAGPGLTSSVIFYSTVGIQDRLLDLPPCYLQVRPFQLNPTAAKTLVI